MAANLIDYYLSYVGASPSRNPGYVAEGVTVFDPSSAPVQQIQADVTTPSIQDWRSHAANPAAANVATQAAQSANTAKSASSGGMSGQFGNSGMTNAQFGGVISNAIQGATKSLANTPTASIPRGAPIETMSFRFPTITYQQRV